MNRLSLIAFTVILIIVVSSVNCSLQSNSVSALDVSSPDCGFGFQDGSYIYFRDPISFEYVEQIASSNVTYGDWVFFQKTGVNERFGFYSTGVNVTVNSFFVGDILELGCVGSGTVKVQVGTRGVPTTVSGTSAVFDQTNRIAVIDVTSSATVQLNWNPNPTTPPGGGGGGGGDPTVSPTNQPTSNPSVTPSNGNTEAFKVSNIDLGEISANSTVTATLHFTYSGSSIHLQSISLPEPFNDWYVQNANFTSLVYTLNPSGANSDSVNLVFNVPNVSETAFNGDFSVSAVDAFGAVHTSTGLISSGAATLPHVNGILDLIYANPLIVIVIISVIVIVGLYLLFAPKRR